MEAMAEFDRRGMPNGFKPSLYYHLVHPVTGKSYPPKAIWGISTGFHSNEFNALSAKRWLENLYFYVHDSRNDGESGDFQDKISQAQNDPPYERRKRLEDAPRLPMETLVISQRFRRNPDVIAERLYLANGNCADCGDPAPFFRAKDGTPFLEVHHVKPLSEGGEDTVENTRALCPNCHRKAHFG